MTNSTQVASNIRALGLPTGARLDGDILTVAVPPGSAEQGCMVSIPLDPAVFTKWPFMLEMDVWSEDVSGKVPAAACGTFFGFLSASIRS